MNFKKDFIDIKVLLCYIYLAFLQKTAVYCGKNRHF